MSRTSVATSKKKTTSSAETVARHRTSTRQKCTGDGMDRNQMVAIAAYYRAERRGFNGGDPVEDWLAAEAEIDQLYH